MKTILITVVCTVLATTVLLGSVTMILLTQTPKTYTCKKLENV